MKIFIVFKTNVYHTAHICVDTTLEIYLTWHRIHRQCYPKIADAYCPTSHPPLLIFFYRSSLRTNPLQWTRRATSLGSWKLGQMVQPRNRRNEFAGVFWSQQVPLPSSSLLGLIFTLQYLPRKTACAIVYVVRHRQVLSLFSFSLRLFSS